MSLTLEIRKSISYNRQEHGNFTVKEFLDFLVYFQPYIILRVFMETHNLQFSF